MQAILVEGGSTAYGMDAGDYGGWAAQLHRDEQAYNKLHRENPRVVINYSLPGLTLPYYNKYSLRTLHNPVAACGNNAARVLSVGLNEAKIFPDQTRPIIDLSRFAAELAIYAEDSSVLRVPTIYVGPQPVDESRTHPIHTGAVIEDDLLEEYAELMREQAYKDGIPYVDVRELFDQHDLHDVLAEDGYHPNGLGHQIIYEGVHRALVGIGRASVLAPSHKA